MNIPFLTYIPDQFILPFRILNFIMLIAVFLSNGLTQLLKLNGVTTGDISDQNLVFLTPAGYTFGIWGLIYALLSIYGLYQLCPITYDYDIFNHGLGPMPLFNFMFNISWIFVWQYGLVNVSLFFIILILITNSYIYAQIIKKQNQLSVLDYWCLIGWRFYFSWVLVASFINLWVVSTKSTDQYIDGALAGYILLSTLSLFISFFANDPIPSAVAGWAFIGISQQWLSYPILYGASLTCGCFLFIFSFFILSYSFVNQLCLFRALRFLNGTKNLPNKKPLTTN